MFILNFSAARTSGTRNYCNGFIGALIEEPPKENLIIYLPRDLYKKFKQKDGKTIIFRTSIFFSNSILRTIWEQIFLPAIICHFKVKALFSSFDIAPLFATCPVVLAVRNPSPLHMGRGWHSSSILRRLRAILQRAAAFLSAKKAALVMYPSCYASDSLGSIMNVEKIKRRVVYHGLNQEFWLSTVSDHEKLKHLSRYGLESDKYFLFVSMLYPYKRPDLAIKAFAMNIERFKSMGMKLVIAGGIADSTYYKTIKRLLDELCLHDFVILAGFVPMDSMPVLYANCRAFLLPTIIETFGQPFVEAMAVGTCVIAADLSFSREICEDGALYFEKDNVLALSDLLLSVAQNDSLVNYHREKALDRCKFFSWKKESFETIALLRQSMSLK